MNSSQILKSVALRASQCKSCPLNQPPYDPGKCVPGTGSATARVFLVGEAPGANEAQQGLPFVGRAGQLLQQVMLEAGYTLDDLFITNTVKHRPPDNRDPTPEERAACRGFLLEQLQAVDPVVVVAIGKPAAFSLAEICGHPIPNKSLRGYTFTLTTDTHSWPVICTWHPSYILRQQHTDKRSELKSDLQAALALARVYDDRKTHRQDAASDAEV